MFPAPLPTILQSASAHDTPLGKRPSPRCEVHEASAVPTSCEGRRSPADLCAGMPEERGEGSQQRGDRVAHVDLISLLIRDGLCQSNCIVRPLQRLTSLQKENLACFG